MVGGCRATRDKNESREEALLSLHLCIISTDVSFFLVKKKEREKDQGGTKRRAISVRRRSWKTGDTKSSGVRGANHPLYECAAQRETDKKEGGPNQRGALIRGETLPPVAPLLAFQMSAADKRARCSRQLKRCVPQLGLSCQRWVERGAANGC